MTTIRLPIDPPVPEGCELDPDSGDVFIGQTLVKRTYVFYGDGRYATHRTCPHVPGDKIPSSKKCLVCGGSGKSGSFRCTHCRGGVVKGRQTVVSVRVEGGEWCVEVE